MNNRTDSSAVNHREIEAVAAGWLAKQDNLEDWTQDDEQTLQAWLQANTAHRVAWMRLRHAWARADRLRELSVDPPRRDPGMRLGTSGAPWHSRPVRWIGGIALAGVAALAVNTAMLEGVLPFGVERYATNIGAREDLALADGSKVVLNTHTSARATVNRKAREFWLEEGEAFFEIQHDPAHPFVVMAGHDRITVLGTKFSVRHENGRTEVKVVEGRVRFDKTDAPAGHVFPASTILGKNDTAVSRPDGIVASTATPAKVQRDLSWRQGVLEFDDESLVEIAQEFNRYNRRQLVVHGAAARLKLSGKFKTDNVDVFLRLIDTGFGVKATQEGEQIHLALN